MLGCHEIAAGAGLCPAGGSTAEKQRRHQRAGCRLLDALNDGAAREEGVHGGTRGSPMLRGCAEDPLEPGGVLDVGDEPDLVARVEHEAVPHS
jgi:hypothetical protein